MLQVIDGDITELQEGVVCHQVNCMNAFGAGLAGQIAKMWPVVKEEYHDYEPKRLGELQIVDVWPGLQVANCFTQYKYGNSKRTGRVYTDYAALTECFIRLQSWWDHLPNHIVKRPQIYFPYGFGCGLAGGDWNIVYKHIEYYFPQAIIVKLRS